MRTSILVIALFFITMFAFNTKGELNKEPMQVINCNEVCYAVPQEIRDTLDNMKYNLPTLNIINEDI